MLIHVKGPYGLFTNPETPAERVSYPIPPFTAVRGMLEAFYWKRGLEYMVRRVYVLNPIRFTPVMRNERHFNGSPTQRRALFVYEPEYVVDFLALGAEPTKYAEMIATWASSGRRRLPVFLGTRECPARVGLPPVDFLERAERANRSHPPSLGAMPRKIYYDADGTPTSSEWHEYVFNAERGFYHLRGAKL